MFGLFLSVLAHILINAVNGTLKPEARRKTNWVLCLASWVLQFCHQSSKAYSSLPISLILKWQLKTIDTIMYLLITLIIVSLELHIHIWLFLHLDLSSIKPMLYLCSALKSPNGPLSFFVLFVLICLDRKSVV